MKTFLLEGNNRISVRDGVEVSNRKRGTRFSSRSEWKRIASALPLSRLVAIWNHLPGVDPIRRFTSREAALTRIWKAAQRLEYKRGSTQRTAMRGQVGTLTAPQVRVNAQKQNKTIHIIALLELEEGVSLERLVEVTGWQKHSIRGFLSGTIRKRLGLNLVSSKDPHGTRVYRIEP